MPFFVGVRLGNYYQRPRIRRERDFEGHAQIYIQAGVMYWELRTTYEQIQLILNGNKVSSVRLAAVCCTRVGGLHLKWQMAQ